jgi:AcrR family transcriptional regulator
MTGEAGAEMVEGAPVDPLGRVLGAAKRCCERWGRSKVTVDDIAVEAGVSRATVYRLFPGGRDNLFEALRRRETEDFLHELSAKLAGASTFEDVVVDAIVHATAALRTDEHLQLMLASEPGSVVQELTVEGVPVILRGAAEFLGPWFAPYIGDESSAELSELLARLVISHFLAPSRRLDLADRAAATDFVRRFILPAYTLTPIGR